MAKIRNLVGIFVWLGVAVMGSAQQQDPVLSILGYPQTILYSGKIMTVDDESFTSNLGTIGQALAIRDGKILAVGQNAEIQALAGPQTQQLDLQGRTVVPGFITVHNHPQDWMHVVPQIVNKAVPEDVMIGNLPVRASSESDGRIPPSFGSGSAQGQARSLDLRRIDVGSAAGSGRSLSQLGWHQDHETDAGYDRS